MSEERLTQDEPGKGAKRLTRWFADRLNARWAVREAVKCPPCKLGIEGQLSERCIVGCRVEASRPLPKEMEA